MSGNLSHPRYGTIQFHEGPSHGHEARTKPSAKPSGNQGIALDLAHGVEAWGFNPSEVVGTLTSLDPAHQKRVAQIAFRLIQVYAGMPADEAGPEHPMFPEWKAAQLMMKNLRNAGYQG